ncbi:MAG: phosphoribosylamine--glycine ligase [Defluviitaleaceae bacterium]|nr:phosphoribosylamine--glycine ligase [Defluviitaleaceae bacterium]
MNNVLIIGSGGREHALARKFSESPQVEKIFVAPGNAGIAEIAQIVDIGVSDFAALVNFAKENEVALTFVGPEAPLVGGIVDRFEAEGLKIFGPRANAAIIEGSKSFAKDLMKKYEIPTAAYEVFSDFRSASAYIKTKRPPFVLKADGLAAGKGVVIAETRDDADAALADMLQNKRFGEAGNTVVIEEFLSGTEFSFMAFVDGERVFPMVIAKDHKRAFDGDTGPNTGGMGAYSPVPQIPEEIVEAARLEILLPTARAMVAEGRPFTGILYAGLIATRAGARVIEFNARFGDPETQVILPRLESDLFEVLTEILAGEDPELSWSDDEVLGVILASKGYPDEYEKGFAITGLDKLSDETLIFHCGTAVCDEATGTNEQNVSPPSKPDYITNGGRVLLAARKAKDLATARRELYRDIKNIRCKNLFYRKDI